MRICIVHSSDLRKRGGFSTSFVGFFKGFEIYSAKISRNLSLRSQRRLLKKLSGLDITFAAVCDELMHLKNAFLSYGITPVDGTEAYSSLIPDMALLFAKENNLGKRFHIQGGSFYTVSRIAISLLAETNEVSVSCADFDEVAEVCADFCGAVIRATPFENSVIIRPAEEKFLVFEEKFLAFSDFGLSLSHSFDAELPQACVAALSSCLKICGFLGDNDIKCELLSK